MALKYFCGDAKDDVIKNRKLMYWTMYNELLPAVYTGAAVLNTIPETVYDLLFNLSICDESEASKAVERDITSSKKMVVRLFNI